MASNNERYKQAAATLAYALCRDAIWYDKACNWIGSSSEDYYGMPKEYAKTLGTNFYDGTAGIAFFLTALYQILPDAVIEKTTHGALRQIIMQELLHQTEEKELYGKLGFYTGWTGCAFVLQKAAVVFNEKQYADAAVELVNQCIQLPQAYWGLDVVDGAAGAIPALIALYRKQPQDQLKEFILTLGRYLIDKAVKNSTGLSWDTMPEKTNNLTGYAHGTAGFAHAFAELFAFTQDNQYLDIVRATIQYENSHFKTGQQNWPDFRSMPAFAPGTPPATEPVCGLAWCHGAPGIGLSRLRVFELTQDVAFKKDAETAIETTRLGNKLELMGNFSLCHGLLGNAELWLQAAAVLQQPHYLQWAQNLAEEGITNFLNKGLIMPNGLHGTTDTPDFMIGKSGMAYFFLRLYDAELFPNMLLITANSL